MKRETTIKATREVTLGVYYNNTALDIFEVKFATVLRKNYNLFNCGKSAISAKIDYKGNLLIISWSLKYLKNIGLRYATIGKKSTLKCYEGFKMTLETAIC